MIGVILQDKIWAHTQVPLCKIKYLSIHGTVEQGKIHVNTVYTVKNNLVHSDVVKGIQSVYV